MPEFQLIHSSEKEINALNRYSIIYEEDTFSVLC